MSFVGFPHKFIRHINPLMIDVIDDKPEGFIMYKYEPEVVSGFMCYKSEGNFARGFYKKISL